MASAIKDIRLTHERDAAWLIALYLAIHGGDPAPPKQGVVAHELQQSAALSAIAVLTEGLDEKSREAVQHALAPIQKQYPMKSVDAKVAEERLEALGFRFTEPTEGHAHTADATTATLRIRPYCIRFRGQTICVEIPSPVAHPNA